MMPQSLITFFRGAFLRHNPQRYATMQPAGAPVKYSDRTGRLDDRQIALHLAGRTAYAVPLAEQGQACLLAFDVDSGGMAALSALLAECQRRQLWAFGQYTPAAGVALSEQHGYVFVPFDGLADVARLRALGDSIIAAVVQPGWRVENRATAEDTRLPLARHQHHGSYGYLLLDAIINIDADPRGAFYRLRTAYAENSVECLPPPAIRQADRPRPACGSAIAEFNADHDLAGLLERYGAQPARGRGRLYLCPFHDDRHASLSIYSRDGQERCRCFSRHSACPLAGHDNDAFNVYCIAERLDPSAALRQWRGTAPASAPSSTSAPPASTSAPSPTSAPLAPARAPSSASAPLAPTNMTRCQALIWQTLLAEAKAGTYYRGNQHLADAAGVDLRHTRRCLQWLTDQGMLRPDPRPGQTTIYHLNHGHAHGHLPPTCSYESISPIESLPAARRGGTCPAPIAAPAPVELDDQADAAPVAAPARVELDDQADAPQATPSAPVELDDQADAPQATPSALVELDNPPLGPTASYLPDYALVPPTDPDRLSKYHRLMGAARKARSAGQVLKLRALAAELMDRVERPPYQPLPYGMRRSSIGRALQAVGEPLPPLPGGGPGLADDDPWVTLHRCLADEAEGRGDCSRAAWYRGLIRRHG